jgi:hypothetical protein
LDRQAGTIDSRNGAWIQPVDAPGSLNGWNVARM